MTDDNSVTTAIIDNITQLPGPPAEVPSAAHPSSEGVSNVNTQIPGPPASAEVPNDTTESVTSPENTLTDTESSETDAEDTEEIRDKSIFEPADEVSFSTPPGKVNVEVPNPVSTKTKKAAKRGRPKGSTKKGKQDDPKNTCPCGKDEIPGGNVELICCDGGCDQWWHPECANLQGLTVKMAQSLKNWYCPFCFVSVFSNPIPCKSVGINGIGSTCTIPSKSSDSTGIGSIPGIPCKAGDNTGIGFKDLTVDAFCDLVKNTVANAVKEELSTVTNSVKKMVTADVQSVTKSYADVVKKSQKEVMEASSAAAPTAVVEDVRKTLCLDNLEREKRKRNVFIRHVPEAPASVSASERKERDLQFLRSELGMDNDKKEIVSCFRTGAVRKDDEGKTVSRPLVVVLKNEECASYWHNYSRGFKSGDFWINADLCKSDREAQVFAWKQRKERQKRAEGLSKNKQEGAGGLQKKEDAAEKAQ